MSRTSTILIADDDPNVLKLLKLFVKPLGCSVISAADGEEALERAQRECPDLVLLDVQMPKKSGWEVCQALKAMQRTANIAVILVTGRGDVKDRLTGLQLGADDYLVKPFDRDEVVNRVGALLERQAEAGKRREFTDDSPQSLEDLLFDRGTDLPTIAMLLPQIKEVLIDQGEIGVIFIDIEQFESIEADYGWALFDEFLSIVGDVVINEARERFGNALIATDRVASSNFFIFLETKHQQMKEESMDMHAGKLRQRLMRTLRARFPKMRSGQIAFFAGAARVDYEPQIRLERQIYAGMKRASDAVRDAEQQKKRSLTRELRDIIKRKQVTTLFQPIVRSGDRTIFGYEILTRGPAGSSFRNSDMLFSFARDNHLSWDLEALALESSIARLRESNLEGKKFLINLEAEMFQVTELRFHDLFSFFHENPQRFVFELTERAAIEDYAVFRKLLDDIRERGVEIAIDDAGSGYASLEAIAALAPNYLKITKSLVTALAHEPIKQDLVRMLVDLAKKIGSQTIAEGIETAQEYEWCSRLGIDLLQGYYFANPREEFIDEVSHFHDAPPVTAPFRPLIDRRAPVPRRSS